MLNFPPDSQALILGVDSTDATLTTEPTDPIEKELAKLGELERRVWNALALTMGVPSQNIARAAGISMDEAGGGLLRLHMAGLATCENGLWQRAHLAA